jgi:RNA polymerase sigma-70 factor, ECF subfamily
MSGDREQERAQARLTDMPPHDSGARRAAPLEDDASLVERILGGDRAAFQRLMRAHNTALFRAARAIVRDDADAEDVLQEAYLAAYRHLGDFRGQARLSTWLTRIVINQALGRLRARRRDNVISLLADGPEAETARMEQPMDEQTPSPEDGVARAELRRLLERNIDALPLAFRAAFMLREVEEMTIEEAAECLAIPAATVRTRVFRARAMLRESLAEEMDMATADVFAFAGARCDRIVAGVLERLRLLDAAAGNGTPG